MIEAINQGPNYFAHPSAIIDPGCEIGEGTKIWHFCHIMPGCKIGENCILGQNVVVMPNVILGNNVKVQNNVSLYEGLICEDEVFLGPSCVFTNVKNPRSAITRKSVFSKTYVRMGATIGANSTIICGIEIGKYAFVGAGSVVTKNISDFALILGNPGRQVGWISKMGERLVFDPSGKATCSLSGRLYSLKDGVISEMTNK